jgi:hypothetical protein
VNAVVVSGGKILGTGSSVYAIASGSGGSGGGSNLIFNYSSGFTGVASNFNPVGTTAGFSGANMVLVSGGSGEHEAGAMWYKTAQVNITSFTTTFTFTMPAIIATFTAGSAFISMPNNFSSGDTVLFAGNFGTVTGVNIDTDYTVSATGLSGTAFQITSGGTTVTPGGTGSASVTSLSILGMTFCVQNSNITTNPSDEFGLHYGINAGTDANLSGYGAYSTNDTPGIGNSVAIKFDVGSNSQSQFPYPVTGSPNLTGLYLNGGPFGGLVPQEDLNPYGIVLGAGHLMSGSVTYDGIILTMVLSDTVTGTQCRRTWPVNIPAIMGGNLGWIGFTAGEIFPNAVEVNSWTFYDGSAGTFTRLATPIFSITPGQYASTQSVSLNGPVGASIYYSTNGLAPTSASTLYSGTPISVSSSQCIQAVAIQTGFTDSNVAIGNYQIATSGTPLINFPSGFSTNTLVILNGAGTLSGSSLLMTEAPSNRQRDISAAWYCVPVAITTFTTNFTMVFGGGGGSGTGMTFTLQNQLPASLNTGGNTSTATYWYVSGGPNQMANDQNGMGYSGAVGTDGSANAGIYSSLAVKFDPVANATGVFTNGAAATTPQTSISGVTLTSGHPIAIELIYNGTTLSVSITDTITTTNFTTSFTINIPSTVNANTAFVGFTAAQYFSAVNQSVSSWTYATP